MVSYSLNSSITSLGLLFTFALLVFIVNEFDHNIDETSSSVRQESLLKRDSNESSCPGYADYAKIKHEPVSSGPYKYPYQRPSDDCRTFKSPAVETVIGAFKERLRDDDLARLFENTFPNTLDTTVRWHTKQSKAGGPRSFIVTGDINAEWIRDSRFQLYNYQTLAPYDENLKTLILGAINQHVDYVTEFPYCNAFQPPEESGISPGSNDQEVSITPKVDFKKVWECKYEIDTLSSFLGMASDYYENTQDLSFANDAWIKAAKIVLQTYKDQQKGSVSSNGSAEAPKYMFKSLSWTSTGTQALNGNGNPVSSDTGLIRSAFRPSDDTTTYQLFIPGNAQAVVEMKRVSQWLGKVHQDDLAREFKELASQVEDAIWKHGTFEHPQFGKVFAYEVDGYGGRNIMDDANVPSLLALPDMGFVDVKDETYQRTRKMIWSRQGNPYFIEGKYLTGIGSPHIDLEHPWPLSQIVRLRTSDNDDEIKEALKALMDSTNGLGLMHESVSANEQNDDSYTRPWFAWVNTEFARALIDVAGRKPQLIFRDGYGKLNLRDIVSNGTHNKPN